ncbi:MAG TPA: hypothetical protein VIS73_03145 [Rhodocyclaceae bacterium]
MAEKSGATSASKQAADSPVTHAVSGSPWHWDVGALWHQTIISQQQWLLEWWLGLISGALQPARLASVTGTEARQRLAFAHRQLGCVGAADLADADARVSGGERSSAVAMPPPRASAEKSGSGAVACAMPRRRRRVPNPNPNPS